MPSRVKSRRRIGGDDLGEEGGGAAAPNAKDSDNEEEVSDDDDEEEEEVSEDEDDLLDDDDDEEPAADVSRAQDGSAKAANGKGGKNASPSLASAPLFYYTFDPANFHLPPANTGSKPKISLASLVLPDPAVPTLEAVLRVSLPERGTAKRAVIRGSDDAWKDGSVVEWVALYSEAKQLDIQDNDGEAWSADITLATAANPDAGWQETGDGDESRKVLEFALKLTAAGGDGDIEEWDNNGGDNYRVVILRRRITDDETEQDDAAGMVPPDERITSWADERGSTPPLDTGAKAVAVTAGATAGASARRGGSTRGARGGSTRGASRGGGAGSTGPVPARPSKTMLAAQRSGQPLTARGAKSGKAEPPAPGKVEILRKPKDDKPGGAAAISRGPTPSESADVRGRGRTFAAGLAQDPPAGSSSFVPPARQFWGHDDRFASSDNGGRGRGTGIRGRGRGRGGGGSDRGAAGPRPGSAGAGDEVKSQGGSETAEAKSQSPELVSPADRGEGFGRGGRGGRGGPTRGRGRGRYDVWDPVDEKLFKERWSHDMFDEINAEQDDGPRRGGRRSRGGRGGRGGSAPAPAAPVGPNAPQPPRGGAGRPHDTPIVIEIAGSAVENGAAARSTAATAARTGAPEGEAEVVVDFSDIEIVTLPAVAPAVLPTRGGAAGGRGRGRGNSTGAAPSQRVETAAVPASLAKEPSPSSETPAAAERPARPARHSIIPAGNSMFQALAAAAQSRGLERQAREDQQKKRAQEREVRAKEELLSAIEAPEFTPTPATPAGKPSEGMRPQQPARVSPKPPAVAPEAPEEGAAVAPPAVVEEAARFVSSSANAAASAPTSRPERKPYPRQPSAKQAPLPPQPQPQPAVTMAYGVPLTQMPSQPTFYTANGMVVHPMMTPTGQMVFMTENGLMVPGDGSIYGAAPYGGGPMPGMAPDYGYGMDGNGVNAGYGMAPMPGAEGYPPAGYGYFPGTPEMQPAAAPMPMQPRPSRPVTLKPPPPADGGRPSGR